MTETKVRIDKYLWAVRIYKTRSIAAEACKSGRVLMLDMHVKPSREIVKGDIFDVKINPIVRTFRVVELLENRVAAKLVPQYLEDLTSPEELKKLEATVSLQFIKRDRGTGRPTKKDRRDLEDFIEI